MISCLDLAKELIDKQICALQSLRDRIGSEFEKAALSLSQIEGKVIVTGLGKSGLVAGKIAATLSSTGTPSIFIHPVEAMHGDLGIIQSGDIGLFLSNSGETAEVVQLLQMFKLLGLKTIAIVGKMQSTLARDCDLCLDASVESEACPLNLAPTSSTTAAMVLGDALAGCILTLKGFSTRDYGRLHPSGALGRRLLFRVKDLMHSGEELPVALSGTLMRDALVTLTGKAMGAVLVVSASRELLGIFTDGDLRRAAQRHGNFLDLEIDELMTKDPIVIDQSRMAAEALSLMENRPSQVSVLPVLDGENKAAGIIRVHDLVRAGL
ncbi:MAG: KpsF/GutQ family sugar-phosphate isomerase [Syntrophobacteraceae bacterium]|nr:KpsF/GutQ family sugar-phosphate isomerase [Syntrophobacteraceae bacterium]